MLAGDDGCASLSQGRSIEVLGLGSGGRAWDAGNKRKIGDVASIWPTARPLHP